MSINNKQSTQTIISALLKTGTKTNYKIQQVKLIILAACVRCYNNKLKGPRHVTVVTNAFLKSGIKTNYKIQQVKLIILAARVYCYDCKLKEKLIMIS
jgi:hypothetical protein